MNTMKNSSNIYDVSAELERELGAIGTPEREANTNKAWEEYNAQILLDARKKAGLTQSELAKRIGADKSYISRIERGITIPTVSTLYRNNHPHGFHALPPCCSHGVGNRIAPIIKKARRPGMPDSGLAAKCI